MKQRTTFAATTPAAAGDVGCPETDRATWDAAMQGVRDQYGMDELDKRGDAILQRAFDVLWALLDMPAPDLASLNWKADYFMNRDLDDDGTLFPWTPQALAQTRADMARLLPEGR